MKKSITKFIALAMSIIIMLTTPAFAVNYGDELKNSPNHKYTTKFNDVDSDYWAYSYIMEMVNRGVLNGYPNGKFYPDKFITRAELAKILTIASGLSISNVKDVGFTDVNDNDWFKPYVNAAANYLNGYTVFGSLMYVPQRDAIREDLAVALVKLKGYDIYGRDDSILSTMFTDSDSISGDAKPYIATALEKGLISGYDDDTFRGQNSITRAEASALLWRAYQYGNGNKSFDLSTITPSTPAPTQTPEPTPEPTEEPEIIYTPTPTEEPSPTPISDVDYVANRIITDKIKYHCYDSKRNLIYFNIENDRYIKSFNPQTEEISNVLSLDEFKYYYEDGYFKNAVITDESISSTIQASPLLYDSLNDRLYIRASYKSFVDPNDYEPSDKKRAMAILYDLRTGEYTQSHKMVTPLFFLTKDKYIAYRQLCEASLDESVYDNYEKNYQFFQASQAIYKDGKVYYICKDNSRYWGFYVADLANNNLEKREVKKTSKDTWTNDGEYFYFVSDKNEIIKYELNGRMTKLLDLSTVENKDYVGFTGKLYKCSNNRYCFIGDDGLKFIKKVN